MFDSFLGNPPVLQPRTSKTITLALPALDRLILIEVLHGRVTRCKAFYMSNQAHLKGDVGGIIAPLEQHCVSKTCLLSANLVAFR